MGTGPVGKIHVGNSGNIKFLKNSYQPDINSIKDNEEQLSEEVFFDLCFFKTLFQSVFLLLIFETMQLHTNNLVNEFKSQTCVHTASAYTYRLERVGYRDFLTPIDKLRPLLCDYRLVIDWSMPIYAN